MTVVGEKATIVRTETNDLTVEQCLLLFIIVYYCLLLFISVY